jgi:hypothetical protein
MDRYHTPKFIEVVKKNLPDPAHSGAKTTEGKERIRYNALKHGLNVRGLLPCKPQKCYYRSLMCFIKDDEECSAFCVIETAKYQRMKEVMKVKYAKVDSTIVDDYIMSTILLDRINRYIAINPELAEECKSIMSIQHRLQNKILNLSKILMQEDNSNG